MNFSVEDSDRKALDPVHNEELGVVSLEIPLFECNFFSDLLT